MEKEEKDSKKPAAAAVASEHAQAKDMEQAPPKDSDPPITDAAAAASSTADPSSTTPNTSLADSSSNTSNPDNRKALKLWEMQYQKLLEFYKQHKHSNVTRKEGNANLAKWVGKQRTPAIRAKLLPAQVQKLNAVEFEWNSKAVLDERQWNDRYERLKQYKMEFGSTDVPQKYDRDVELGTWVANQRRRYNQGKLRNDRKDKLEALNFTWLLKGGGVSRKKETPIGTTAYDAQWNTMYDKLCDFYKRHGHTNVCQNEEGSLGMWVSTQRRYFHKKTWIPHKGLRDDRRAKLEAIGFEWNRLKKNKNRGLEVVESEGPAAASGGGGGIKSDDSQEPPSKRAKTSHDDDVANNIHVGEDENAKQNGASAAAAAVDSTVATTNTTTESSKSTTSNHENDAATAASGAENKKVALAAAESVIAEALADVALDNQVGEDGGDGGVSGEEQLV